MEPLDSPLLPGESELALQQELDDELEQQQALELEAQAPETTGAVFSSQLFTPLPPSLDLGPLPPDMIEQCLLRLSPIERIKAERVSKGWLA
jgi:hypothetical protein